jgi:spermidine/putrescine transport system ATP-binding protein
VIIGVRPEKVELVASADEVPSGRNALPGGVVTDASFIGVSTQYLVKMPWGQELSVFEQNTGKEIFRPGTEVALHWDASQTFGLDGSQDIEAGAEIDDEAAK